MAKQGKDNDKGIGEGAADTPEGRAQAGMRSVRPVDLELHGDGIDHWQDEPDGPPSKDAETRKRPEGAGPSATPSRGRKTPAKGEGGAVSNSADEQTGEALCPRCSGSGKVDGQTCPRCGGSGTIVAIVGDA